VSGRISPARVILPVGIGTALSLPGVSTLYTVLPTHTEEAGISLAAVGALLGALSTLLCTLVSGFWPFLAARTIWGLSWSRIWVGGATILLSDSPPVDRGKWLGAVQVWFFAGTAGGSLLGGWFTDLLGYRTALAVLAALCTVGVFTAAFALPGIDDRPPRFPATSPEAPRGRGSRQAGIRKIRLELAVAALVEGINRLVLSGILAAILNLLVRDRLASLVVLVGVSTLAFLLLPRIGPAPLFNASAGGYALCILLVFLARRRWEMRMPGTGG
jgi:MFS family permease